MKLPFRTSILLLVVIFGARSSTREYLNEFISYLTEHCVFENNQLSLMIILDTVLHLRRKRPTVFQVLDLLLFQVDKEKRIG